MDYLNANDLEAKHFGFQIKTFWGLRYAPRVFAALRQAATAGKGQKTDDRRQRTERVSELRKSVGRMPEDQGIGG